MSVHGPPPEPPPFTFEDLLAVREAMRRERERISVLWKRDGIMSEPHHQARLKALAAKLEAYLRARGVDVDRDQAP